MKILFISFSLLFAGVTIGSESGPQKNKHDYKALKFRVPKKESLWKFRDLDEKATFIVISSDKTTVFYKRHKSNEQPTGRKTSEFVNEFKLIKK